MKSLLVILVALLIQSCASRLDSIEHMYGEYSESCTRRECIMFEFDVVHLSSEGYRYHRITDEICPVQDDNCWTRYPPYSNQYGPLVIRGNHIRLSNLISDNDEYFYITKGNEEYLLKPAQYDRYLRRNGSLPSIALRKAP